MAVTVDFKRGQGKICAHGFDPRLTEAQVAEVAYKAFSKLPLQSQNALWSRLARSDQDAIQRGHAQAVKTFEEEAGPRRGDRLRAVPGVNDPFLID